jgi:hypothetical protein
MINVAMVNRSSVLTDHTASTTIPAFQTWLDQHVIPAWGIRPVKLSYVPKHVAMPPHAGLWPMYLLDTSDVPGAGGYHEDTGQTPDGKVFVKDAITYHISWTVDFSHELVEMLVDPQTDRWVPLPSMPGWNVIVEPGDPVEADALGRDIGGVLMTDFVLPAYFGLPTPPSQPAVLRGLIDWLGHLDKPAPALLPEGYVSLRDPTGRIRQLFARDANNEISRRAARVSRLYRK